MNIANDIKKTNRTVLQDFESKKSLQIKEVDDFNFIKQAYIC